MVSQVTAQYFEVNITASFVHTLVCRHIQLRTERILLQQLIPCLLYLQPYLKAEMTECSQLLAINWSLSKL